MVCFQGGKQILFLMLIFSILKNSKSQKLQLTASLCMLHVIDSFVLSLCKLKTLKAGKDESEVQ